MKRSGVYHGEVSKVIAELEHFDTILIGDAGMPCQPGVKLIDLAVCAGVPSFFNVLKAILGELKVQRAFISSEMAAASPAAYRRLIDVCGEEFPIEAIAHDELKRQSGTAKAHIRTGECTPYCNILLEGGVTF